MGNPLHLPDIDTLPYFIPDDYDNDLKKEMEKVPRFFKYNGGIEDIDENREIVKTIKCAAKTFMSFSLLYITALNVLKVTFPAIISKFRSLLPHELPLFLTKGIPFQNFFAFLSLVLLVKEAGNITLKRYLYFGNLISGFSVLKEQLAKSRLKLLNRFNGLEVSLYNHKNERIDAVYFIGKDSKVDAPTVLYFNSAAGFYEVNEEWIERYLQQGYNVLTFNYPGYCDSESYPNHRSSFLAGKVAMRYLKEGIGLKNEQILAHGHSLGGPHAAFMAAHNPGVHLCIERSFSVLTDVVRENWGVFGQQLASIILDGFDINTQKYFKMAKGFKWVIEAKKDKTIPHRHGMAQHAEKVIWHQLNFANAHQDDLTAWEYQQHFNYVREALGKPVREQEG